MINTLEMCIHNLKLHAYLSFKWNFKKLKRTFKEFSLIFCVQRVIFCILFKDWELYNQLYIDILVLNSNN